MSRRKGYKLLHRRPNGQRASILAPLVNRLEHDQLRIVSINDLASLNLELGIASAPADVARDLRVLGYFRPLRSKGRWEFITPAQRQAGASNDPFIELRASLGRRQLNIALAYDSAAWLHGLAPEPSPHVLASYPFRGRMPPALSPFRITRTRIMVPVEERDGLPVWSTATLLAHIAITPHNFRGWENVMKWLTNAFAGVDPACLERELTSAPDTARVRLAYLASRAGDARIAQLLVSAVCSRGVTYLGPIDRPGRFVRAFNLVDSLLPSPSPTHGSEGAIDVPARRT
jgi:hypothetical protein